MDEKEYTPTILGTRPWRIAFTEEGILLFKCKRVGPKPLQYQYITLTPEQFCNKVVEVWLQQEQSSHVVSLFTKHVYEEIYWARREGIPLFRGALPTTMVRTLNQVTDIVYEVWSKQGS